MSSLQARVLIPYSKYKRLLKLANQQNPHEDKEAAGGEEKKQSKTEAGKSQESLISQSPDKASAASVQSSVPPALAVPDAGKKDVKTSFKPSRQAGGGTAENIEEHHRQTMHDRQESQIAQTGLLEQFPLQTGPNNGNPDATSTAGKSFDTGFSAAIKEAYKKVPKRYHKMLRDFFTTVEGKSDFTFQNDGTVFLHGKLLNGADLCELLLAAFSQKRRKSYVCGQAEFFKYLKDNHIPHVTPKTSPSSADATDGAGSQNAFNDDRNWYKIL